MEPDANLATPNHSDGSSGRVRRGMRGNLLWYIPLFGFVVWYFGLANARAAYENISLVLHHWTWMLLVSPSAYVFFSTALYSVLLPIHFMLFIPSLFSADAEEATYDRRYVFSFLVLLALIVGVFVTQLVIRGSFPLCWPADGVERLRLVPFLPCPK
jgi:hypothetical protein